MIYVLIALAVVATSTFVYSIHGALTDELVVWEQMDWTPTYPYGVNCENPSYIDIRNRYS